MLTPALIMCTFVPKVFLSFFFFFFFFEKDDVMRVEKHPGFISALVSLVSPAPCPLSFPSALNFSINLHGLDCCSCC